MNKQRVNYLDAATWPRAAATSLAHAVARACQARGSCSVMLTGGRSAAQLYDVWSEMPEFSQLRNVRFFFGDERSVPPDHPESNFGLAMRTLFKNGVPLTCEVIRMKAEQSDREAAAVAYESKLPMMLDVILLSVGEDGHIASLFPNDPTLWENRRRVVSVKAPKPPMERLTVTPLVISQANKVFVLAIGSAKAVMFQRAQTNPIDILELPARLVLNCNWFLDSQSNNHLLNKI